MKIFIRVGFCLFVHKDGHYLCSETRVWGFKNKSPPIRIFGLLKFKLQGSCDGYAEHSWSSLHGEIPFYDCHLVLNDACFNLFDHDIEALKSEEEKNKNN